MWWNNNYLIGLFLTGTKHFTASIATWGKLSIIAIAAVDLVGFGAKLFIDQRQMTLVAKETGLMPMLVFIRQILLKYNKHNNNKKVIIKNDWYYSNRRDSDRERGVKREETASETIYWTFLDIDGLRVFVYFWKYFIIPAKAWKNGQSLIISHK